MGKDYEKELELRNNLIETDNNKFVMAGAGAGKTYSLVKRINNQIRKGVDTSSIVAISFTNKSAEDLREKIITSLDLNRMTKDELASLSEDDKKIIKHALDNIDLMHISTIHKFCSDIVRENSIYTGKSPDFTLLDAKEDAKRKDEVFNAYFRMLGKEELEIAFLLDKKIYSLSESVKKIYDNLVKHVDGMDYDNIFKKEVKIRVDEVKKALNNKKNHIKDLCRVVNEHAESFLNIGIKDTPRELFKKEYFIFYSEDYLASFDTLYKEIKDFKYEYKYDEAGKFKGFNPFNSKAFKGNQKEYYEDYLDDNMDNVKKVVADSEYLDNVYKNYCLWLAYLAYKVYLSCLEQDYEFISNDQLLVLTNKLLDNEIVRKKLQNKYKHIYIDEYQDTDHIQRDIALKLTQLNNDFIDNSIFLVGDPKQSIYRFRGAEPEVYFKTKELFNSDASKSYDLNINFRSNSEVLKYINEVYPNIELTGETYSSMLVSKANMIDEANIKEENLAGFYQTLGKEPIDIARLIKYLKKNYKIRKKINDEFIYTDIKYSDIMVQMRNTNMEDYVKTFTECKIPSMVSGSSNFYYEMQLRSFVNLFEALNTRGKKAMQMAYEVFKINNTDFIGLNEEKSLDLANKMYFKLHEETKNMTSYGIAIYLIENLNWINKTDSELESFEINSIKSKLYQMVEDVFSKEYANGSTISNSMRDFINNAVEYESLIDDKADSVQVINVHKAKGLEKPIVIYVCNDSKKDKKNTILYNGVLYIDDYYDYTDDIYTILKEQDLMENARIEYVAATRPREALIFAYDPNYKRGMFSSSKYKIEDLPKIEVEEMDEEESTNEVIDYEVAKHNINKDNPLINITSPSSMENNESTLRNKLLQEAIDNNINYISYRPKGNILGTVLHRAFELLVLTRSTDYKAIANTAIKENEDDIAKTKVNDYLTFITTCLEKLDNYYKEKGLYGKELELYPELTFSTKLDDSISNGSIDLLVNSDIVTIIDYKSDEAEYITDDNVFEETLLEKYKNQLDEYEKVVKNIIPNKKIEKKIIYFRRYNNLSKTVDLKIFEIK